MKKRFLIFTILLTTSLFSMAQKKVAVWDAKCIGGADLLFEADLVQGSLEETVDNMPGYKKYDRAMFDKVMKEHKFERSGAVDDNQIKEMGEYAGVDYIFVPSVASKSGYVNIVVRCIDIKTGESKTLNELSSADPPMIKQSCDKLTERLLGGTSSFSPTGNVSRQGQDFTETAFGINMKMIYVEGGAFSMGCTGEQGGDCDDDEKNVRQVTVDSYYIGMLEVTQSQWFKVMGGGDLWEYYDKIKEDSYFIIDGVDYLEEDYDMKIGDTVWAPNWNYQKITRVGPNYPMYFVEYYGAMEFCKRLSAKTGKKYTLPTEAQWEYAARGGNMSKGTKYAGGNKIDELAWYERNSGGSVHLCGTLRPNELGIYDMSGNVSEWVKDIYSESYLSFDVSNPAGPQSDDVYPDYVFRGGDGDTPAKGCRVSSRDVGSSLVWDEFIGFRVVCIP